MTSTPSLASIPSPSSSTIDIGPLSLTAYGLMIALGVIAAVWLFGRRLEARGAGTRDDASSIAIGAVIAGVIGARLYHVITDWDKFSGNLGDIPRIWEGGLGIPGGLIAGIAVGLWMARARDISLPMAATCAAPALPLAQAIGRWGNWFNQELFGRPTDLPWALEIDPDRVASQAPDYIGHETFHPTFLYESLWNLGLFGILLGVDRTRRLAPGSLIGVYVAGYGIGRFWVEGLRIDEASEVAGLRWNQWMAVIFILVGIALFVWLQRRGRPEYVLARERVAAGEDATAAGPTTDDADVDDTVLDDHSDADDADAGADADTAVAPDPGVDRSDELDAARSVEATGDPAAVRAPGTGGAPRHDQPSADDAPTESSGPRRHDWSDSDD